MVDKHNTKKIFIGMPVYNGEKFLRESISSIINQSYTDWEMFISDDASIDHTGEIAREYAEKDLRITYYRQEKNLGMFPNFKFVLDKVTSPYFIWAAQDDIREKNYLKVCIDKLEKNKNLGLATTVVGVTDSFGRTMIEERDLLTLSNKSKPVGVIRYVLQPEILGKCNLMYGLFKTSALKTVWQAYPQREVWGQDYMFSLALISRFSIYVDKNVLFKKRQGGFSNPENLIDDKEELERNVEYKNPKNYMFPFGRFCQYFKGHMEALRGTHYAPLVALLLLARLPRAFIIHIKERDLKKFIKKCFQKN